MKINQWVFHNARVNTVSWSPDSKHAVSGSLDTNVEVWSVEEPMKHISIKGAHLETVSGVVFLDDKTIASAGGDATIKVGFWFVDVWWMRVLMESWVAGLVVDILGEKMVRGM